MKSDVDKLDIDQLKNVPTNCSNLKSKVDKLDVDKLVPAPVDLSKLSDVLKNDIVKKDVYNAKIKMLSSSVHIDNENKDISILGEGPTQGLDDTTLTAEAKFNFTQSGKRFVLSLHYNGSQSFLFVNATKYINSKQKNLK